MSESQEATTNTTTGAVTATVGDMASTSQINSSASASVPSMPSKPSAPANDMKSLLGDLGEDPVFKDFKDVNGLAKAYKDTKSLVGQKLGIPAADASPETKAAFNKAMGIPETAEGYVFETPADLPETMKETYATELKAFQVKAKALGLTIAQAKAIQAEGTKEMYEALKHGEKIAADKAAAEAEDEKKFDAIATKMYGDKKAEKLAAARAGIEEFVPAEFRDGMAKWTTEQLLVFSKYADGLSKKYNGKEDITISKGETNVAGQTQAQLRDKARQLQSLPEYNNPFAAGKERHEEIKKQVQDIYAQIAGGS